MVNGKNPIVLFLKGLFALCVCISILLFSSIESLRVLGVFYGIIYILTARSSRKSLKCDECKLRWKYNSFRSKRLRKRLAKKLASSTSQPNNLLGAHRTSDTRTGALIDPNKLLKEATELKKSGNVDTAIEVLKEAYREIEKSTISYGVEVFLRLPQYLQIANRNDEAWREFQNLLSNGYPNQLRTISLFHMDHSLIYDKMRLFLQRENKPQEAVIFAIFSHLSWAQGLFLQERDQELREHIRPAAIEKALTPHLKKANLQELKDDLVELVTGASFGIPNVDLYKVSQGLGEVINKANQQQLRGKQEGE